MDGERVNAALVCGGCGRPVEVILAAPVVDGRLHTPGLMDMLHDHAAASRRCVGSVVHLHMARTGPDAYGQIMAQVSAAEGRR